MRRSSFLLTVAAGLLASLAFGSSARAGSILETFAVILPNGLGATATDITVTYTGGTIGLPVPLPATGSLAPPTGTLVLNSPTSVTDTFPMASTGSITFYYTVLTGTPTVDTITLSGVVGSTFTHPLGVSGGSQIIPEPTSMALLGIGMTGFFAFRRFFKRTAVA